jgi:Putative beta barrel porin-7 (BBP7)
MRKGFLGSLAVVALGAGLAFGQPYGPPAGPGGRPPYPMPDPGVVPGPPSMSGPSVTGAYSYTSPDGHPIIMPPGLDGMIPPGSMGAGAPGGAYPPDAHFGSGGGILQHFGGGHVWGGVDYLWWTPKSHQVRDPLVTTSAAADLGVLGAATTVALCGPDDNISIDNMHGWRAWLGCCLDGDGRVGVEVGGFWLQTGKRLFEFNANGAGLPVLAVPFINADTGANSAVIVAFPGVSTGSVHVLAETNVRSAELSCVFNAYRDQEGPGCLEFLIGARFFQLEETFGLQTQTQTFGVPPLLGPGTFFPGGGGFFAGSFFGPGLAPYSIVTNDNIRTFNNFYAGQVGFRGEIGFGKFFTELTGKFAAGYMRSWADLEGTSTLTASTGLVTTQPGGIFNEPQDLCRHHADRFAMLGEGGINVGCQLGCLRLHVGYTFLWVNNVLRPTTSLSPVLNPALTPTSPSFTGSFPANFIPRNVTRDDEFFLHGFNVGAAFSF